MKTIKIAAITLITGLLAMPAANAASFQVNNDTDYNLAFYISGKRTSALSTVLAHQSKTVSEADFRAACGKVDDCIIESYVVVIDPPSIYAGGIIYNEKRSSFFLNRAPRVDFTITASLTKNPSQLNVTYTSTLEKK